MISTLCCPSCRKTLRVPESLLGQTVKCPSCTHIFMAPESMEESAPLPTVAYEPRSPHRADPSPQDDYEDYDEEPAPRPRRRRDYKPGKVQAIAIMMLVGGILAALGSLLLIVYCGIIAILSMGAGLLCCLWPGPYYGLVVGIMAATKGARLLGDKAYRETPPQSIAIMMIVNIINFDGVNLVLGILILVFLSDEEVKNYFR